MSCPKCGCCEERGPYYDRVPGVGERLRYACNQCGYERYEPTLDQKIESLEKDKARLQELLKEEAIREGKKAGT